MKPDIIYRPGQRLKDNKPKPTASLADAKPVSQREPKTVYVMPNPTAVTVQHKDPINKGGRPSTKGQVRIFIKEILKNLHANIPPHETIKGLSEIERDILLEDLLLAHRKRQKAKAKAQKRWRVKITGKGEK